jgi:hypothetical protein
VGDVVARLDRREKNTTDSGKTLDRVVHRPWSARLTSLDALSLPLGKVQRAFRQPLGTPFGRRAIAVRVSQIPSPDDQRGGQRTRPVVDPGRTGRRPLRRQVPVPPGRVLESAVDACEAGME